MNLLRHQEHFIVDLRGFYLTAWASFLRNSSFQAGLLTAVSEKLSVLTLLYSARQRLKFKNDYFFSPLGFCQVIKMPPAESILNRLRAPLTDLHRSKPIKSLTDAAANQSPTLITPPSSPRSSGGT